MKNAVLRGKSDAGNPHVRFDEGEVASAKPRRGSLLYNRTAVLVFTTFLVAGAFATEYKYAGGAGTVSWANDWNSATDADTGNSLWSSGGVPTSDNDYVIDKDIGWIYFKIKSNTFSGGSLTIASPDITFDSFNRNDRLNIPNLTVNAGSRLITQTAGGYSTWPHGLWLTGTPRVDGTLTLRHKVVDGCNFFGGYLTGALTGNGLVTLAGDTQTSPKILGHNWRIVGDNSGFKGRFAFEITEAMTGGESFATGVEILNANALGGARDSFTPDALTVESWNGLVTVGSDITLNAANSGILMKGNSFFEVPSGYVLTVAEPIRLTGGFYKRGAGTLALDSAITFGADGTAEPDGANNALSIKAGALKIDFPTALALSFAAETALEVGPSAAQAEGGFCRSLSFDGPLSVTVDFSSVESSEKSVPVNLFKIPAELAANVANIQLSVKGNWAAGALSVSEPSEGLVTVKTTLAKLAITYTGNAGTRNWRTSLNDKMDSDDSSQYLWSDHAEAHPDGDYYIGKSAFFAGLGDTKFNGKSLEIGNAATVDLNIDKGAAEFAGLTVDAGAKFNANFDWLPSARSVKSLKGTLWEINGTLTFSCLRQYGVFSLDVPVTGSGRVEFGGYVKGTWADPCGENQCITSDNSAFAGKFLVSLPNTVDKGESCARGVEISAASALGGALDVATPDALTLASWNGLVATDTLTLDTANRGIDLKANAFFDVAEGKTLTVKEPIRSEGGFYKRGAGTLVLDSAITFGADGTAEPDGVNNLLAVKQGTLRCVSATATENLSVAFAAGTELEIDPTTATKGLVCCAVTAAGVLSVAVDFGSSYVPGASETVALFTVPTAVASSLLGRVDVKAKGSSNFGTLSVSEPVDGMVTISTTLTVPKELTALTYTGSSGFSRYSTSLNAKMDGDDSSKFLWSDNEAAHPGGAYAIGMTAFFVLNNPSKFGGDALRIFGNGKKVSVQINGDNLEISHLQVDSGATFDPQLKYDYAKPLVGTTWVVDGTLNISVLKKNGYATLNAPIFGSGLVVFGGWADGWDAPGGAHQVIASDNSGFRGKFEVSLPNTTNKDASYARGVKISSASALGGAPEQFTFDALTLNSWNGLVATETLTLDTANRGIDLKANAFFEVVADKTLTIAEPIRSEGGFYKRGAGTLAFGAADVTLGADGTAVADGVNNAFRVAAGAVRPTGTAGLAKLATTFADGAALEIGALDADPEIATNGFYQPLGITLEGAKLPVNVVFPSGFSFEDTVSVVLATVPTISAQALSGKIAVNAVGLAHRCAKSVRVESADDDLSRIVVDLSRDGLFVVVE